MISNKTELLAPAGSWEALRAAVNAGADAVYFGGTAFGARQYASNFNREEIEKAVSFAHMHRVRLYVTVNTLVDDGETPELVEYLLFLNNAGIDGIIVQDLGVVSIARKVVPELPLHASTQMTVTNSEGASLAYETGMERVVLARECSLEDIKTICAQSEPEIEVFIHGALCVCYSGQCLMSSLIGGRSGNRGRCAQPCRLPYALVDDKGEQVLDADKAGQYLLSPRDMNTLDILPELIKAGVASFKIEGRMKRPEYVAVVVDIYRRALDSYKEGCYEVSEEDRANIRQIFNRDFTTGFLKGNPGKEMMSDRRPNNRGVLVGRVTSINRKTNKASIRIEQELHLGDGLEFWVTVGGRVGTTLREIMREGQTLNAALPGETVEIEVPKGVKHNDRVFRTFDKKLMDYAQRFCGEEGKNRIPVKAFVKAKLREALQITLTDDEGNRAEAATSFIAEAARKHSLNYETLHKQLDRMGNTEYVLTELLLDCDENIMVPVSEINEARRIATEALNEVRTEAFAPKRKMRHKRDLPCSRAVQAAVSNKAEIVVQTDTMSKAETALAAGADWLLIGGESFCHKGMSAANFKEIAAMTKAAGKKLAIATPRIVTEGQLKEFARQAIFWEELEPDSVFVANYGLWHLLRRHLIKTPLWADWSLNIFNTQSLVYWQEQGAQGAVLSPELTMQQVESLAESSPLPLECLVQGRLEMMVSEYCVTGSFLGGIDEGKCGGACSRQLFLQDRLEEAFPIVNDQFCRMHILNAHDLSMLKYVRQMSAAGVKRLRIDARYYGEEEVRKQVSLYRQVLDGLVEIDENMPQTTRGHYFRGVL